MRAIKTLPFKGFRLAVKPFMGTGIGRFRLIGSIYSYLASALTIPEDKRLLSVNGYEMFLHVGKYKGIDGIAQHLLFTGTYEPYTTFLFKQLVKEGMAEGTILFQNRDINDFIQKVKDVLDNYGRHRKRLEALSLQDNFDKIMKVYQQLR